MLKLNRKTEYALLALRYMGQAAPSAITSVHEIAAYYNIPEMLLAKVLQRLKHGAIVTSVKGSSGGYALVRPLGHLPLTRVLGLFDEQTNLVECIHQTGPHADLQTDPQASPPECQQQEQCDIRRPIEALNALFVAQLEGLSLDDFFAARVPGPHPRELTIFRPPGHRASTA